MKARLALIFLAVLVVVILVIRLWPMLLTVTSVGPTSTPFLTSTENHPTRTASPTWPLVSPTSIPRGPTRTSIPGETAQVIPVQTSAPIEVPTLILPGSVTPLPLATLTLIPFITPTLTPYAGTATPTIPIAYVSDGRPRPCYKGPSRAYMQVDTFTIAQITGKDRSGKWWFLLVYKGQGVFVECWVAGRQVHTGGDLSGLSVTEPELSQLTTIKFERSDQLATGAEYIQIIACDALGHTTIRVTGQIFATGPIEQIGYIWETDAPGMRPLLTRAPLPAWDTPAQAVLDLSIPSQPGSYTVNLRTTFPGEIIAGLRVILRCRG